MKPLAVLLASLVLAPAALAQPTFSKQFLPADIGPGNVTTLRYTIDASASGAPVTALAFTDAFPAGLTVASPAQARTTCSNNASAVLAAPRGGSSVTLSGGSVRAGGTCTVTVLVTGATPGDIVSTSGDLTSSEGNSGSATATLRVQADRPSFSKAFSPAMVAFQGRSRLTFTVDNGLSSVPVSSLSFTDDFPAGLTIADPAVVTTTCRNESPANFPTQITADPGARRLSFSVFGFNSPGFRVLDAGASCTIGVDVVGGANGELENVTSDLAANNQSVGRAGAVLTVATSGLSLAKMFVDDPVPPGGTVELEYTVRNLDRREAASGVTFTDDLDAALAGLAATDLPLSDVCGPGSELSQSGGVLTLTGGTLPAAGVCTFSATLQVPAGAAPGTYASTTSEIAGTVGGEAVTGLPAAADLFVATVPRLVQSFVESPVSPGEAVTLRSTLTNTSPTSAATDIGYTQVFPFLPSAIGGAVTLPADGFCGAGSQASIVNVMFDTQGVQIAGASLGAAGTCTFDVGINLPAGTPGGTYTAATSAVAATVDGESVSGPPARPVLVVIDAPRLATSFPEGAVAPGAATVLAFELTYSGEAPEDATAIAFTDDLGAALAGLVATDLPIAACGGTLSSADGGSTLEFAGGRLSPGETCAFTVPVTVPAGAAVGTYTNTTSALTAQVGMVAVSSAAASGELFVTPIRFAKAFTDDPVDAGQPVTLEFSIENTGAADAVSGLLFTDNLSAVLSGLASTSGTQSDVCGSGSSLSGTTFLIFSGGSLAPGARCTFSVTLAVPGAAEDGTYSNITSPLTGQVGGGSNQTLAQPATASLLVGDVEPTVLAVTSGPAEGWRMFAAPVGGLTVGDLTAFNLVSGVPTDAQCGNAITNLFTGYRGGSDTEGNIGSYVRPGDYADALAPGRGFFWYFYDDPADAGPCGEGATASSVQPLPVTVSTTAAPPETDVTTTFVAAERAPTEDTFYLAGNPFGEGIDLEGTAAGLVSISATDANGAVAFQNTVHIWDAGAGGYVTRTARPDGGTDGAGGSSAADNVSIWQGLWLERSAAAAPAYPLAVTYDADYRTGDDGTFVGKRSDTETLRTVRFELSGTIAEQPVFDGAASVLFAEGASADWDAYDASKLSGLAVPYALLAAVGHDRAGAAVPKAAESRALDLDGTVTVPLVFRTSGPGALRLAWPELGAIPDGWTLTLTDAVTGEATDLRAASEYAFTADAAPGWTERLALTVSAPAVSAESDLVDGYAVGPVFPNPARSAATVSVAVAEAQAVRAEVYNVLGQRVATVFDGSVAAGGSVPIAVETAGLAAGSYTVRVVGETFAETRRLTVVR